MTFHFPKSSRLRNRREFLRLYSNGERHIGQFISIDICSNSLSLTRLGITVTKKYGNSCKRNRFKRMTREAFRLSRPQLPQGCDIHIRPRKAVVEVSFGDIYQELVTLLAVSRKTLSIGIECS